MTSTDSDCWLQPAADGAVIHLRGRWRLSRLTELDAALRGLAAHSGPGSATLDGAALEQIDTAAALLIWQHLQRNGIAPPTVGLRSFDGRHSRILELVRQRLPDAQPRPRVGDRHFVARIGVASEALLRLLRGHLGYFGQVLAALAQIVIRPSQLRIKELAAQLSQVCVSAIPVVALVTFLIGLVVAYLLGLQAEKYGANIFVVDGVALGLAREFSPLIVATIIAGRSGAAFTAQLGTMKLTEEIDAIRTLGLSAEQVLVVPRVLALVLTLPLLVLVGDVMGLLGAMAIADAMLDITPATFVARLQDALSPRHYLIGLAKAPVFALFIAVIGCRMGMSVNRDTRSIGMNTTSTVVQSIVAVILLDALFAVWLQALEL